MLGTGIIGDDGQWKTKKALSSDNYFVFAMFIEMSQGLNYSGYLCNLGTFKAVKKNMLSCNISRGIKI